MGAAATIRSVTIVGFRALPGHWRERLKESVGALGYAPSWAQRLRAELALWDKRLDVAAGPVCRLLAQANVTTLRDRVCMEYGSGWLLAEPLLYHLAGARRIYAVDYFRLIQPALLRRVCDGVDEERLISALAGLDDASAVWARYRALISRRDWTLDGLASVGILYVAPFDAALERLPEHIDVMTSFSVLEHVPTTAVPKVLGGLVSALAPDGVMVHGIHLEDHRDLTRAPFAFLGVDTDWTEAAATDRGNRLRPSEWRRIAEDCGRLLVFSSHARDGVPFPERLHPRFTAYDVADLRASGVVLAMGRSS